MGDISNRVVMRFLVVALVLIIVGTILSINKLTAVQEQYQFLSGAAVTTATGQTNLTITSSTSLTNQKFLIDFGSGNVNASCEFCAMDSNNVPFSMPSTGVNASSGACCGAWNYSQTAGFLLENTGNQNLSVGYT